MGAKKDGSKVVRHLTAVFDFALIALPGATRRRRTQVLERALCYTYDHTKQNECQQVKNAMERQRITDMYFFYLGCSVDGFQNESNSSQTPALHENLAQMGKKRP